MRRHTFATHTVSDLDQRKATRGITMGRRTVMRGSPATSNQQSAGRGAPGASASHRGATWQPGITQAVHAATGPGAGSAALKTATTTALVPVLPAAYRGDRDDAAGAAALATAGGHAAAAYPGNPVLYRSETRSCVVTCGFVRRPGVAGVHAAGRDPVAGIPDSASGAAVDDPGVAWRSRQRGGNPGASSSGRGVTPSTPSCSTPCSRRRVSRCC
jgi:hypothetical protein